MRVISGKYRGKKLLCCDGDITRPTLDRVKEAMFGSIQFGLFGANVLDLFAGSGALGIEALSRGAAFCDFVELNDSAYDTLRTNLEGITSDYHVYQMDYLRALTLLKEKQYNYIFLDPPYDSSFYIEAFQFISEYDMLCDEGYIIVETKTGNVFEQTFGFNLSKQKKYGSKTLLYYIKVK